MTKPGDAPGPGPLKSAIIAVAAACLRLLGATWRVSFEGPNPLDGSSPQRPSPHDPELAAPPHLAAFWHRNVLIAAHVFRDRSFSAPVSRSRDGDWIAGLMLRLGYVAPPRGSSSRGGAAALRSLARLLESGTTLSIQTDGPRGPARRSKPGVIALARLSGVAITPLGFSASPCIRFGSWDGTLLPLPFAQVRCRFGAPQPISSGLAIEDEAAACERLDRELNALTDALDDALGHRDPNRDPESDSRG